MNVHMAFKYENVWQLQKLLYRPVLCMEATKKTSGSCEGSILLLRRYVDSTGIQIDMIKLNNICIQERMKSA